MATVALVVLSGAVPSFAKGAPEGRLEPCRIPGVDREAKCGSIEVFENRVAAKGRRIRIEFVVIPATGPGRLADPIFDFEGGPGASAIRAAPDLAGDASLAARHDLVLVDIRGTGKSNGLQCESLSTIKGLQAYLDNFLPVPGVRTCRRELETHADLHFYTTPLAVDDVDDVRAALGYEKIDLFGGSYGSRSGLEYLRRHGDHVRGAIFIGLDPPNTRAPLTFAADAQAALDKVFAACAKEPACHAAFPDPAGDLAAVLARVAKAPVDVEVHDPQTGAPEKIAFTAYGVAQTVRYMLYVPLTAARIPLEIHLAANGDFGMIASTAMLFAGFISDIADGYFLSVTCSEEVPFFTSEEAVAAARGTFLGDFRTRMQKAACAEWVRGELPPGTLDPVRSDPPVILLSGERDPVTPARAGAQVASTLPHAVHLVVPAGGHGFEGEVGTDCLQRLESEFFDRGSIAGLDTSCIDQIRPAPFVLADDREKTLEMTAAQLDEFVGTYVDEKGSGEIALRRGEHGLLGTSPTGRPFALTPTAPDHFRIEGAPPGYRMEFERESGRIVRLVSIEGTERFVFRRQQP